MHGGEGNCLVDLPVDLRKIDPIFIRALNRSRHEAQEIAGEIDEIKRTESRLIRAARAVDYHLQDTEEHVGKTDLQVYEREVELAGQKRISLEYRERCHDQRDCPSQDRRSAPARYPSYGGKSHDEKADHWSKLLGGFHETRNEHRTRHQQYALAANGDAPGVEREHGCGYRSEI